MTVHEIYTGRAPFSELHLPDRALSSYITSGKLPILDDPIYATDQVLPDELREILVSCWNQDPVLRPTMEDIQQKLSQIHRLRHLEQLYLRPVKRSRAVVLRNAFRMLKELFARVKPY